MKGSRVIDRDREQGQVATAEPPAAADRPRVAVRGLVKRFAGAGTIQTALEGIDLDIRANEFVSLLGPSGCGKTTLLRIIGGLVNPSGGEITIDGDSVPNALRARKFGFVFQDATLLPWRTVADNAALLLDVTGQQDRRDVVESLLETRRAAGLRAALPVAALGRHAPARRARPRARARAPRSCSWTSRSRPSTPSRATAWATSCCASGTGRASVVFVTHSIPEAVLLSDRVVVMSARPGRIVADVTIDLPRPRDADVRTSPAFLEYQTQLRSYIEGAHE